MASTYPGEPREAMRLEEVPEPIPGEGEVRLRVLAANVNFPDALLVRGQYQITPPLPFTPGVEICGETEDGHRVIANPSLPHGGFAEYVTAPARALLPAPDTLDDAEAAALHIGYQTGWFGLHRRARLQAGRPCSSTPPPVASAVPPCSSARPPGPPSSAWSAARRRSAPPRNWAATS